MSTTSLAPRALAPRATAPRPTTADARPGSPRPAARLVDLAAPGLTIEALVALDIEAFSQRLRSHPREA
ncbi:hypothetical protein [Cellulomonas sp. PhB143]|uniref:hypothetical protein n=1 Tax=Cellulomonas sp. PhB143 TaxID=2485186 RepID=UPI000F461204|nr:hypothetical protein [Cellulomonas sp. PhB143]ROS77095.1 hypothetical protein EDF32_1090 [Cellulomonas sp. PhB143]